MLSGRILLCVVFIAAWASAKPASLPFLTSLTSLREVEAMHPLEVVRGRVREGVPPPLCAGRCAAPPQGPVCAFDATGTARTFRTLCELEAVSCRESTYYAITSLGEC